jgi:hypothetical protein
MAIEKIARLAGHASSRVTETVYRQELRPVLQEGAEVMDRLFGSVDGGLVEQRRRTSETGLSAHGKEKVYGFDSVSGLQLREVTRTCRTGRGSHSGSQMDPAPAKTKLLVGRHCPIASESGVVYLSQLACPAKVSHWCGSSRQCGSAVNLVDCVEDHRRGALD